MNNHQLTKKEKYLIRKQRKEQERLRRVRRKKIKRILLISLPVITAGLVIFLLVNYLPKENQSANQGVPEIEISPQEYDAGTVSMTEEKVQYTYEIKNKGDGDLKISRIWTSCMCTTARLKVGDKESPEFDMHSNPAFWSQKIAPGQTGYLEVSFDQAFHGPQGVGKNIRAIYVSSNDLQNKQVEVRLITNVIP